MAKKKHRRQSRKVPSTVPVYRQADQAKPTWQLVDRNRSTRSSPAVEHTLIDLDDNNIGESAWRRRENPRCRVLIPAELLCLGDEYAEYETLAREHGAFIFRLDDCSSAGAMFGIWGTKCDGEKTLRAIRDWIDREKTSKNASGANRFTGLQAMTPRERARAEKAWVTEVRKERFRQAPPEGSTFDTIGKYTCDMGSNIEEAFGRNLEALDPIRITCACNIICQDDNRRIQVLGSDMDTVADALARIRRAWLQLHSRQVDTTTYYFPILVGESIALHEYTHTQPMGYHKAAARPPGKCYRNSEQEAGTTTYDSHRLNTGLLSILEAAIKKLHHLQARVVFEIRLGTFLAMQHLEPVDGIYAQAEFEDMLTQSQFIGSVTEELGNIAAEETIFDTINRAEGLFEPLDVTHLVDDIRPTFVAVMLFVEGPTHIQLTMTWQQQGLHDHSKVQYCGRRWSKADRMQLVDTNVLDLEHGYAWHINMHATTTIREKRIPPHLVRFADRVKFDESTLGESRASTRPFVKIPQLKTLKTMRTESCRTYRCKDSPCVLKVTRFQDREYNAFAPHAVTIYEPRVSVALYNPSWSAMLVQNEILKIGSRTQWSDRMLDWFPSPSPDSFALHGIDHLTNLMSKIGKVTFNSEHGMVDQSTGRTIC